MSRPARVVVPVAGGGPLSASNQRIEAFPGDGGLEWGRQQLRERVRETVRDGGEVTGRGRLRQGLLHRSKTSNSSSTPSDRTLTKPQPNTN